MISKPIKVLQKRLETIGGFSIVIYYGALLSLFAKVLYTVWVMLQSQDFFSIQMINTDGTLLAIVSFAKGEVAIVANNILNQGAESSPKWVYFIPMFKDVMRTGMLSLLLYHMKNLFETVTGGNAPFRVEITRAIRSFGIAVLSYGFIMRFCFPLIMSFMNICNFGAVAFDIPTAIIGGSLFALSGIFEYGTALQVESDELL